MNKELEEMIKVYKEARDNRCLIASIYPEFFFKFGDTLLNYIENSIPKEKVENIINPLIEQANNLYRQRCFTASNIYSIIITKFKERITRRKISHTTYEV